MRRHLARRLNPPPPWRPLLRLSAHLQREISGAGPDQRSDLARGSDQHSGQRWTPIVVRFNRGVIRLTLLAMPQQRTPNTGDKAGRQGYWSLWKKDVMLRQLPLPSAPSVANLQFSLCSEGFKSVRRAPARVRVSFAQHATPSVGASFLPWNCHEAGAL